MARKDAYQVWVETGKLDEVLEFIKECARKLVTQKEMCKYLGISQDSFSRLKRKYPIIAETQLEAKTNLKIDLAGALYKKAIGFEVTEETHHIDDAHGSRPPRRKIVRNIKYIAPETRAIIYLLTQNFGIEYAEKFAEIQMIQKRAKDEKEVAEKLHVTNKTISRWERRTSLPDIVMIKKLSIILNFNLNEMFDGIEVDINDNEVLIMKV